GVRSVRLGHLPGKARDAAAQDRRSDHPDVGAEAEDPGHHLPTEPDAHAGVDPAPAHERLPRAGPTMTADGRRPAPREADLDVVDGVHLVHEDPEAVREHALRVVAVLVRVLERSPDRLGRLDAGEAVGVGLAAARPADDVELVVVDGERERFDADRPARALEVAVAELQPAAALEGVDHLLEHLLLLGEGLLSSPHEEYELPPRILEALGVQRV